MVDYSLEHPTRRCNMKLLARRSRYQSSGAQNYTRVLTVSESTSGLR